MATASVIACNAVYSTTSNLVVQLNNISVSSGNYLLFGYIDNKLGTLASSAVPVTPGSGPSFPLLKEISDPGGTVRIAFYGGVCDVALTNVSYKIGPTFSGSASFAIGGIVVKVVPSAGYTAEIVNTIVSATTTDQSFSVQTSTSLKNKDVVVGLQGNYGGAASIQIDGDTFNGTWFNNSSCGVQVSNSSYRYWVNMKNVTGSGIQTWDQSPVTNNSAVLLASIEERPLSTSFWGISA